MDNDSKILHVAANKGSVTPTSRQIYKLHQREDAIRTVARAGGELHRWQTQFPGDTGGGGLGLTWAPPPFSVLATQGHKTEVVVLVGTYQREEIYHTSIGIAALSSLQLNTRDHRAHAEVPFALGNSSKKHRNVRA